MKPRILVVDDETVIAENLRLTLEREGYDVETAPNTVGAMLRMETREFALGIVDLILPDGDGLHLLRLLKAKDPSIEVIIMTGHGSISKAVEATKQGAFYFVAKPFDADEMLMLVGKALERRRLLAETSDLRRKLAEQAAYGEMLGSSPAIKRVFEMLESVAASDANVLIVGESGTGKELAANAVHAKSSRVDGPMVKINCAALPKDLIESELFGHVKGAFTGASTDKSGLLEVLAAYLDPNYASVLKYQNEVIVFLLVAAGLALLVRRSRTLVAERAEAERARGNLARYFSPKVVDTLAERDEPLGRVRRQAVGVLFADLVGFTTMAEEMTPEEVMALLRDFHGRMEEEVFRHNGCLEKFIGDALLATFGVPDTGRRDATDALACARGMLAALDAWNREREAAGLRPLQMGLGLHYGPVVAGDIGSRRSMAFATVGDTTNVTSRLQALTRELRVCIVASEALVTAVQREAADLPLLHGLHTRGAHVLRGRDTPIELWAE